MSPLVDDSAPDVGPVALVRRPPAGMGFGDGVMIAASTRG